MSVSSVDYVVYPGVLLLFSSISLVFLRNKFFVPCIFLPSVVLTKMKSDLVEALDQEKALVQNHYPGFYNILLTTEDGVRIDTSYWINPSLSSSFSLSSSTPKNFHNTSPNDKWLLWINPNAAWYEQELRFLRKYAIHLDSHFICFNYRGSGHSEGSPKIFNDLVLDAKSVYDFLQQTHQAKHENILIHGHSMGGAVGSLLRSQYFPQGPIINDRSFQSFPAVATALSNENPALLSMVGSLLGFWTFFSYSFLHYSLVSPPSLSYLEYFYTLLFGTLSSVAEATTSSTPTSAPVSSIANIKDSYFPFGKLFSTSLMGGMVGIFISRLFPQITNMLTNKLLSLIGWDVDVVKHWKEIKGKKLVLYHQLDGIIFHDSASLYYGLKKRNYNEPTTKYYELKYIQGGGIIPRASQQQQQKQQNDDDEHLRPLKRDQLYHCYSLDTNTTEFSEIIKMASEMMMI